ncbi:MAG: hypothetical protein H0U09_00865 [Geodermatophilaceae bacterium]|nr:hypothetical protein [Geodermatophilaceae bacterium]
MLRGNGVLRSAQGLDVQARSRTARSITRFSEPYASIALDAETAEATMSASQSSTWLTRIRRTGVEPNRGSIRSRHAGSAVQSMWCQAGG